MIETGDGEQTNLPAEMGKNPPSGKKPNHSTPNPNTPQKQRTKDMEQFWKTPFAKIRNLEVLSRYMIM